MKRSLMAVVLLGSAVALAQGAPSKKKSGGAPAPAKQAPAPAAANDGPDVSKLPFTPDSIQQVMLHNRPRIQECYEDHMVEKDKKVEGKLLTTFTITPEGMVASAKVDKKASTLKDAGLNDCVVAVLMSLSFPKPPDGRDHPIEYPFNLKAIE